MSDPQSDLRESVSSLRTIGTVFLILGCLGGYAVSRDRLRSPTMLIFGATAMLLWVAPGTLYHMTAVLLRKRDARIALVARWTAVIQCVLAVVAFATSWLLGAFTRDGHPIVPLLPATVTIFFSPALLLQAYLIGRAVEAAQALPPEGHAFQVQPMPVEPVEDHDAPA